MYNFFSDFVAFSEYKNFNQLKWLLLCKSVLQNKETKFPHGSKYTLKLTYISHVWALRYCIRCSSCHLVFACWELSHVIFLTLRKKKTVCKAEQIHKMKIIFTQNGPRLSICEFAQLCKQFLLSQLEKNHLTQLPTAKN